MTTEIHSSPAAQWLQGLLAKGAPSQIGSRSNPGAAELPRDSSRISAQAFQLNQAAGASTTAHARSGQPLAVSAPLPHHHVPARFVFAFFQPLTDRYQSVGSRPAWMFGSSHCCL